jgi:hypothetical protein
LSAGARAQLGERGALLSERRKGKTRWRRREAPPPDVEEEGAALLHIVWHREKNTRCRTIKDRLYRMVFFTSQVAMVVKNLKGGG